MRRKRTSSTRILSAAAAAAATCTLAGLSGCAQSTTAAPRPATRIEPEITPFSDLGADAPSQLLAERDEPLFVPFGRTLIVPASSLGLTPGRLGVRAKLDDGRDVPLTTHRIDAVPILPAAPLESTAFRWLGGAFAWSESSTGFIELVEVRLPVDAFGHWLWVGDKRVNLEWLGEEKSSPPRASDDLIRRAEDPFVRECLRLESYDPRIAWRARLLGVTPAKAAAQSPIPFAPAPSLIESPDDGQFLERLADQTATLWHAALASLRARDPDLAQQVVNQLTLIVEIDSGGRKRLAPAWAGADEAAALLTRLLQHRDQPRRLAAVADEWLRARPQACAWVADDAGLLEGSTALPLVRVGVANLGSARLLVSAKGVIDAGAPELMPLAPRTATTIPIAPLTAPAPEDATPQSWGIDVRCGDWTAVIDAQRRHLAALPPGLSIGPFSLDHAANAWVRSTALVPLPGPGDAPRDVPALVGRLVRDAGPGGVAVGSGWSLYLEAERSTSQRQTIRVWFGSTTTPAAVVTAELPEVTAIPESGEGTATVKLPGRPDSTLVGARVVPGDGRWAVRLPIPNSAIERPGRVRLAVEHLRGNVRSTWPRAQFPWQTEPGRASVDLSKW